LFGHLWVVELTSIFCSSSIKFTLRCQQSDIIPITPAVPVAKFAAGIVDTSGKFATDVDDNGSKFAGSVIDASGPP
jgi:hypothetical protein